MLLESPQNPKIKNLIKLQEKSRERKKQGVFVVEGVQENSLALQGGFEPVEYFICSEIYDEKLNFPDTRIYEVSPTLFEKVAYRGTTEGILGVYKMKENSLSNMKLQEDALIVVLEAIEKPGNLGAILRTCDGAGVDLLVVCDPLVDFYNPNVIRSSVGTVFTNQFISTAKEDLVEWMKKENVQIVSTFLREDTQNLYELNFPKRTAVILGTEAVGLSDFWLNHSDALIKIPMNGKVDSLNVSNAAAICIYEWVRQKSKF